MTPPHATPAVVAVDMGYGHLRAARPLADALGTNVLHVDRPPLADRPEQVLWQRVRRVYEVTSRLSQAPFVGGPFRRSLEAATDIPALHPARDMSAPTLGVHLVDALGRIGLGRGLVDYLRDARAPLLTTYFTPAILADRAGLGPIWCVVTDTDINRAWVPVDPVKSRIVWLAPSRRAERRLQAYGVPADRIRLTGFPLPHGLVGGPDRPTARRNLARRLVRLDPRGAFRRRSGRLMEAALGVPLPAEEAGRPPLVSFAVGGAGAQTELAVELVAGLKPALRRGVIRLTLVAGVRREVAEAFERVIAAEGLRGAAHAGVVEILHEPSLDAYFQRMDALLAETDVLWTKPSEMVFHAALGLPLVLSPAVGVHERYNRRWVLDHGAGLLQRDLGAAASHLEELLEDGTLATMAFAGFVNLPADGLYRILDVVGAPAPGVAPPPDDPSPEPPSGA